MQIEVQERGIHILRDRHFSNLAQHPCPTDTVEHIVLHDILFEQNFLYDSLSDRGVFHQLHLILIVEKQRIIPLSHEETLHLPLFLVNRLRLVTLTHRQRKDHTIHLQFLVGGKVEDEVVKKFVHRLRSGCLTDQHFQRVYGSDLYGISHGVGLRLFCPLRLVSRTGEHQQDTCDNRNQKPLHLTI